MEYRISKQELGNNWLYSTLAALERCMSQHGLPLYVVGATARDISLKLLKSPKAERGTKDLDVAIAIKNWSIFNEVTNTLLANNFTKDPHKKQKFYYRGDNKEIDYEVDIVPFGGVEENETVSWPPEGNPAMSVRSFQDVMKAAVTVTINESVSFKMAPLYGQFLMKLDAWNDRHLVDDRDAEDMYIIADNYFMTMIGIRSVPEAVEPYSEDTEPIIYSARWLACEASKILTTDHLVYYINLIDEELKKEERSELITQLMSQRSSGDRYTLIYDMWSNYLAVLSEELNNRSHEN